MSGNCVILLLEKKHVIQNQEFRKEGVMLICMTPVSPDSFDLDLTWHEGLRTLSWHCLKHTLVLDIQIPKILFLIKWQNSTTFMWTIIDYIRS